MSQNVELLWLWTLQTRLSRTNGFLWTSKCRIEIPSFRWIWSCAFSASVRLCMETRGGKWKLGPTPEWIHQDQAGHLVGLPPVYPQQYPHYFKYNTMKNALTNRARYNKKPQFLCSDGSNALHQISGEICIWFCFSFGWMISALSQVVFKI